MPVPLPHLRIPPTDPAPSRNDKQKNYHQEYFLQAKCFRLTSSSLPLHGIIILSTLPMGFPGGASSKESSCQCRRHKRHKFNPWVKKIPWRRKWQSTPMFLHEKISWTEEPGRLQSMEPQSRTWLSYQAQGSCEPLEGLNVCDSLLYVQ